MKKFWFIARMPNEPGTLHKAAEIIKRCDGNINRIHHDHRIDPRTVFFEVTASNEANQRIKKGLRNLGYLQTSLPKPSFLKFDVYLPHLPGALFEFLKYTTSAGANLAFLDFDDRGSHPERLTVALTLENSSMIESLLNQLKSRYRLEIEEYDTTAKHLDDTVFYLQFAQRLRQIIGEAEDEFVLRLLHDIDHIAQELTNLGEDPKQVFASILLTGKTLKQTTGEQFYADVQRIELTKEIELFCFQLPCGGNIFLFNTPEERVMIDMGFGIYHQNVLNMLHHYGLGNQENLKRVFITHADADHTGASGYFNAPAFMHQGTKAVLEKANRAYGSRVEDSILEAVYTKLINLFSRFNPPKEANLFHNNVLGFRGIFPVIERFKIDKLEFEVLKGLGGLLCG